MLLSARIRATLSTPQRSRHGRRRRRARYLALVEITVVAPGLPRRGAWAAAVSQHSDRQHLYVGHGSLFMRLAVGRKSPF